MIQYYLKSLGVAIVILAGMAQAEVSLHGAGTSLLKPMYDRFIVEYALVKPEVKLDYLAVGSGAGIKRLCEGSVDFGSTDSPVKDEQLRNAVGGNIFHIPIVMNGVVPIYNLDSIEKPVNFTGAILADIFLGKITRWNDPGLVAINDGINLPNMPITVVHRSDSSGTTAIFTDYLSRVSEDWKNGPGKGSSVKWPVVNSIGGKGGISYIDTARQIKGSISYVELIYALENKTAYGSIQNKAGKFIHATLESITAAVTNLNTDTGPGFDITGRVVKH